MKICPKCKAINPKIDFSMSEFHSYETCRNVIDTKKFLGIFNLKIYCNSINSGEELGAGFDNWIYREMEFNVF